jgi:hypothetical protein
VPAVGGFVVRYAQPAMVEHGPATAAANL